MALMTPMAPSLEAGMTDATSSLIASTGSATTLGKLSVPASNTNNKPAAKPPAEYRKKKLLHLFSGPADWKDGLLGYARLMGADGEDWDIVNGGEYDLVDDLTYGNLSSRIEAGEFDAGMLGPPCGSFWNARREDDFGPRPLRFAEGNLIYGRQDLSEDEAKTVKEGTLLALRALEVFMAFRKLRRPVILEQPAKRDEPGAVSVFDLPEFKAACQAEDVSFAKVAQCAYGAPTSKPIMLLRYKVDLGDAKERCDHSSKWWRLPSNGSWRWGPPPSARQGVVDSGGKMEAKHAPRSGGLESQVR